MAVTLDGDYYIETAPSTWSGAQATGLVHAGVVSCGSATMCIATDADGNAAQFNGSTWGDPNQIGDSQIQSLSCPSVDFCMATNLDGQAIEYNAGVWESPVAVAPRGSDLEFVSCPSSAFCGAISGNGFHTFDGSTWSSRQTGITKGDLYNFTCASPSMCVAVLASAKASVYNGVRWGRQVRVERRQLGLTSVSCPTTTFCMTVDYTGHAVKYINGAWRHRTPIDPRGTWVLNRLLCQHSPLHRRHARWRRHRLRRLTQVSHYPQEGQCPCMPPDVPSPVTTRAPLGPHRRDSVDPGRQAVRDRLLPATRILLQHRRATDGRSLGLPTLTDSPRHRDQLVPTVEIPRSALGSHQHRRQRDALTS